MSYEPTLVIRKSDLVKALPILEQDQYSGDEDTVKVANYLLNVNKYETVIFDNLELVLCSPELTSFNELVRVRLDELNIDFREVEATTQILELFNINDNTPPTEQPKLVGHLNRSFGYNGFKTVDIGTEVYSYHDIFYFEMIPDNGDKPVIQKFYKPTLTPHINFIEK